MFDNALFQKLVEADNLTGEVVAINRFIVEVKGLEGVRIGAQILFEDGQRGFVREAHGDRVILYNIDSENLTLGCLAVVEYDQLSIPVGPELIGRVVTPMGVPVDDKGQLTASQRSGIFTPAPGIMDRKMLETIGSKDMKRMKLIDSAITRIEQGKYGLCMKCGKKIPKERLEAIPYALLCIECQSADERRNR